MIDLSALSPFIVAFLVFGTVTAGLAVATIAWLTVDAVRTRRSRPVVLITNERTTVGAAA